jgi:hypothetical protein
MSAMMVNSDVKTALLGLIAAAAFIAAAFVSAAPARSEPLHRISAIGISEMRGAHDFNEWRARRIAIERWRREAASRYGREFAHWFSARDAQVVCDGRPGFVRCEASAVPAIRSIAGGRRWNQIRT